MHATPLEPPRERPLHTRLSGRCPSFSPRLAIAAGIRHEGGSLRRFFADAIWTPAT